MKNIVSANLVRRVDDKSKEEDTNGAHDIETQYDWNPDRDYFKDETHPCRVPFNISTGVTMESFWMKVCNVTSEICR